MRWSDSLDTQSQYRVDGNIARVASRGVCETIAMPHARVTGTAWDRHREDYAYTRELDFTGWAWEFLRRNEAFRRECRLNRVGHPTAIRLVSGTTLYRPRRRFLAAEEWGLALFVDPDKTALEADVFWLPEQLRYVVQCHCKPTNDNGAEQLSLHLFHGRRAVLSGPAHEQVTVQGTRKSASLVVTSGSILFGKSAVMFLHEGLNSATRHHETLTNLRQLTIEAANVEVTKACPDYKYLDYLIALDGQLEGRTYRDIAEVLYGKDRVGTHWTDDTRWMKSKVRRAVAQGLALMNGGYRDLL